MGKTYKIYHTRPKRINTRKRRGSGNGSSSNKWSSMIPSSTSMKQTLQKQYQKGLQEGQKHINSSKKMAKDLHKQGKDLQQKANDRGKKSYSSFKYSGPTNYDIVKSSEKMKSSMQPHYEKMHYEKMKSSMQPHYEKMKSSMQPYYEKMKSSIQSSNGSSMGFSQLSKNKTDINALEHAQKQAILGTSMQNDPINQRQMYLP
jgi:hypothetical protein